MARTCPVTGKRTTFGNTITRRGKAKYLGGVGRKVTGCSRRRFRANMQRVRVIEDGQVKRIWVSARAIRMGAVIKPLKRSRPQAATTEAKS